MGVYFFKRLWNISKLNYETNIPQIFAGYYKWISFVFSNHFFVKNISVRLKMFGENFTDVVAPQLLSRTLDNTETNTNTNMEKSLAKILTNIVGRV